MTGFVAGAPDPGRWAWSPRDLSRAIAAHAADPVEVHAAGRAAWVASRWDGPVLLTDDALDRWADAWRGEVLGRKAR